MRAMVLARLQCYYTSRGYSDYKACRMEVAQHVKSVMDKIGVIVRFSFCCY
jgi:hypothetical protein